MAIVEISDTNVSLVRSGLETYRKSRRQIGRCTLLLGVQGTAQVSIKSKHCELIPGRVLFLYPTDTFCLLEATPDFLTDSLSVSTDVFDELMARMGHAFWVYCAERRVLSIVGLDGMVWRHCFDAIRIIQQNFSVSTVRTVVILQLRMLFHCLAEYAEKEMDATDTDIPYSRMEEITKLFMHLLATNISSTREVSFYADQLHITPKHLNTSVRSFTGRSPKEIIDAYLIDLLKTELKTTEKNIEQIADRFHFTSQSYMGRFFKRQTGYSPSAFRKITA